jgi:hypothetical protein
MFCRGFERIKIYIRSLTHVLSMVLGEALRVDNFTNFDSHMSVHRNIIPNYSQQDATFLDLLIFTDAVNVSDISPAHHQEHTTVQTASGIVK